MGQAASRQAAKQAKMAVGSAAKSSAPAAAAARPPPLGRPTADAPEVIEDAMKALSDRQTKENRELQKPQKPPPVAGNDALAPQMPMADQTSGFYRGQISDPRDVSQEKFLIHQSGAPKQQSVPEMAPDLLKFLQDMGPIQKKINKDMTSSRIVKELEQGKPGEESERMQRLDAEANLRTRDDMRLVEDIEGFSTPRTTNFFYTSLLEEEEADFGLTDLELYDLLKHKAVVKDEPVAKLCSTFHREKLSQSEKVWTDEEKELQQQLLTDTLHYLALPVIVKDADANYLGVYQKELEREFHLHNKIDVVDESRVKLVLADIRDLGKKEIKRLR